MRKEKEADERVHEMERRMRIETELGLSEHQKLKILEAELQHMDKSFLFSIKLKEGSRLTMLDSQKNKPGNP